MRSAIPRCRQTAISHIDHSDTATVTAVPGLTRVAELHTKPAATQQTRPSRSTVPLYAMRVFTKQVAPGKVGSNSMVRARYRARHAAKKIEKEMLFNMVVGTALHGL